jgi:tetratricopeptide (TPR) repeat protein
MSGGAVAPNTKTFCTRAAALRSLAMLISLTVTISAQDSRGTAQEYLQRGVDALKSAQYETAAENLKKALDLDPSLPKAKFYLATAYANQFIPGATSDENMKTGQQAIDEFKEILKDDPNDIDSVAAIASIYFNMKKLDDAREWYEKQMRLDSKNAEVYYSLGVIAWTKAYPARMKARADSLISTQANTPFTDNAAREALCKVNLPIIEDGFKNLNRAVELRPDYNDAMAYLNLLYREKADCEESMQDREKDLEAANFWVTKCMEIKAKKAAAAVGGVPQ